MFDGHGGHSAADYMSKNLYKILTHSIDDETHNSESSAQGKAFDMLISLSASAASL